jgi:hypothetical protein
MPKFSPKSSLLRSDVELEDVRQPTRSFSRRSSLPSPLIGGAMA